MNDSHFENLIKAYRKVQMTPEEKREVFKQSMLVIEKIEAVSLAHSDKRKELFDMNSGNESGTNEKQTVVSTWLSYIKRRQFVPAMLSAFILLFAGGASLLADEALPGDSLYSFKVNVNEPLREFTAVTNEAKAKLAVEVTERRLQEAALLSSQGKLDEDNKKILQDQFVKRADQIRNRVASLVESNNLNAAQEVVVDFESALKTHELILERLSLNGGIDPTVVATAALTTNATSSDSVASSSAIVATNIQPMAAVTTTLTPSQRINQSGVSSLLLAVKSELDTTKLSRIGIDEKVMATFAAAPSSTTADLAAPTQIIDSNIKELRFTITDIQEDIKKNQYGTSTLDLANRRIASASTSIAVISENLKAGKLSDAAALSRSVLQSLAELQTVLKLELKAKTSFEGKIDLVSIIEGSASTTATTTLNTGSTTSDTIGQ